MKDEGQAPDRGIGEVEPSKESDSDLHPEHSQQLMDSSVEDESIAAWQSNDGDS